ncbi:MAG TPA: NAD(P)H-binding protein [Solirubrobacteraceae bacterium]
MIITVLGATGATGQEVVQQALDAGHEVRALVRRLDALEARPGLKVVAGDATDPTDVAEASRGTDVVISALGTGTGLGKSTLMTDAIGAIIEASEATGVKRFILVSSYVVGAADRLTCSARLMSRTLLRNIKVDKARSETLLKSSDLAWTIVDPPRLTNEQGSRASHVAALSERISLGDSVARSALAAWMLAESEANAHVRDEVVVTS